MDDERGQALPGLSERWVPTADGRHLHLVVAGTGTDLVVLEAGLGAGALSWGPVLELLAPHCRVVAYDRAGYGRSDPDLHPRDLSRLADDLITVVGAVDHARLVLAGHSWGGPVVRLAAARLLAAEAAARPLAAEAAARPLTEEGALTDDAGARGPCPGSSLVGLVLVDPSDEHAELYFSRAMRVMSSLQGPLLQLLARTGVLRPLLRAQASALPEPYRSRAADSVSTLAAARTMVAENAHVIRGLRSLHLDPLDLDAVPLTVVSGCSAGRADRAVREQLTRAHAISAAAHPRGRHVRARRSGHLVPFTEPELVADEILDQLA